MADSTPMVVSPETGAIHRSDGQGRSAGGVAPGPHIKDLRAGCREDRASFKTTCAICIEGMKNRQPAFESLHKVAILAADRHDTLFSPRFVRLAFTEYFDELANLALLPLPMLRLNKGTKTAASLVIRCSGLAVGVPASRVVALPLHSLSRGDPR